MIFTASCASPLGGIVLAADEIGLTGLWFTGAKYFGAGDVYKRQISHSRCSSFRMAHASCAMPRSSMTLSRRMAVRRSSSAASGFAVLHSSERRIGSPMTTSVRLPKP